MMQNNHTDITWTSDELLTATDGTLICGNATAVFSAPAIDSRKIRENEFFVAIKGENFDGHAFIEDLIHKGTTGFIINRYHAINHRLVQETKNLTIIGVDDTIQSLGRLAAFRRNKISPKVIAITGSNGKTTTKEMTASVFGQKFKTLSTAGNFNNEIGLPLTLFNLKSGHQAAVVELGMNHLGEISRLAGICQPDIGIVTNVGTAHIEGLGSIENVARAKGELIEKIGEQGTAVLNMDDDRVRAMAEKTKGRILYYGFNKKADIRGEFISETHTGMSFNLFLPTGEKKDIFLKTPGQFMMSNALAAAAAGFSAGLTIDEIKRGLEAFTPVPGRMNIHKTKKGFVVIDDTYNANPDSVKQAIQTLKALKEENNGIIVMGDMFELGENAAGLHREIGGISAKAGMKNLYATGAFSEEVRKGAEDGGMDKKNIVTGTKESIAEKIIEHTDNSDWILVKGSRAMRMEEIVRELTRWGNE